MIEETIHKEHVTFINIYTPNWGAPRYIKQLLTELKGETDKNIIIVLDLNTPLPSMDT